MLNFDAMKRACASTEPIVERVLVSQLELPTPCTEWSVHDLLNHVLGTFALGAALLGDTEPEVAMGPGEVPSVDLVGDDPVKAYRHGVESLLAAAGNGALDRMHATPLGEMPGAVLGGFTTLDIFVHGWDLARAIGLDVRFDDGLAGELLAFAKATITDETRAPRIGPEVEAPAGATVTDRLMAFVGRRP